MTEKTEQTDQIFDRLNSQIEFIMEIDKLKNIFRRTKVINEDRYENDAEHSWHLALVAVLLQDHAREEVDIARVIKMVLIHDLVEIDAGDIFVYDEQGEETKYSREKQAALRIFGLLPEDQEQMFWGLWEEFEEQNTPEARFATSLDRMQPILNNYHKQGGTWREYNITREQVEKKNGKIVRGSENLWDYIEEVLDRAEEQNYITSKNSE